MRIISSGSSEQWKESVILPRLRKMQTDELGGLLAVGALTRGLKSRPFILIRPKALFCLQMVVREQEYLVPQRVASQGALASIFYSLRATLPSDSHVYRPAASASLLLASAIVSFYSFICFQPRQTFTKCYLPWQESYRGQHVSTFNAEPICLQSPWLSKMQQNRHRRL